MLSDNTASGLIREAPSSYSRRGGRGTRTAPPYTRCKTVKKTTLIAAAAAAVSEANPTVGRCERPQCTRSGDVTVISFPKLSSVAVTATGSVGHGSHCADASVLINEQDAV